MSAPVPDGGTVHTEAVTPDTDPVAAAAAALREHNLTCAPCHARLYLEQHDAPGEMPAVVRCSRGSALAAVWRRALRHAPLNHAPAGGQITTEGAAG